MGSQLLRPRRSVVNYSNVHARPRAEGSSETRFLSRQDHKKEPLFSGISHPLDRRKELKMAVIAVGSRPETPDVTKFFELPAVDRRFEGMEAARKGKGGLRILGIHISVGVGWGRRGRER